MCASFNAAFNAIIIRNVHTARSLARSPVRLILSKETRDNRQMREAVAHRVRFVSPRR